MFIRQVYEYKEVLSEYFNVKINKASRNICEFQKQILQRPSGFEIILAKDTEFW